MYIDRAPLVISGYHTIAEAAVIADVPPIKLLMKGTQQVYRLKERFSKLTRQRVKENGGVKVIYYTYFTYYSKTCQ